MKPLTARQISLRLNSVPLWSHRGSAIRRRFEFPGFPASIAFVRRVAVKAEKAKHHPDIDIRWNKVALTLTTHSEGGLTEKDFSMAQECDQVAARHFKL
jgi:4a-hydroxytetrahydrobiopterin dehydratase